MRILITGSDSFLGKNLQTELANRKFREVKTINEFDDTAALKQYVDDSDFIFHLLTVYRSDNLSDFIRINIETTRRLTELIGSKRKQILLLSSTQAGNGSPYGQSKLEAEQIVKEWMNATGGLAYICRLPNEFGKWCPPRLNSVVSTFCSNIAKGENIEVDKPDAPVKLAYIDDIINCFILALENRGAGLYCEVEPVYETTVGDISKVIQSFQTMRATRDIPDMQDGLIRKLYSTYLSYLPPDGFATPLQSHIDKRGSFTEVLHFGDMGQMSLNVSKPGITKGNHWHHTKNEKFVVISGRGVIRFRKVGESEITEYRVSGDTLEVVDIPPGYVHNITNTGENDMMTIIWANEIFDSTKPDTYCEEV